MPRLTTPIPQDKIGESFVWRDWFQRLSDKVFGTLAQQDANNVAITGGSIGSISLDGNTITHATIIDSAINNTPVGLNTPAAGSFTSISLGTPLPIASGGTAGTATPTAGAVAYGNGTSYRFTAVGTAGQVLTSGGVAVPTWTTALTTGTSTSILYGNGAGGFSNVVIGTGVSFSGGILSATDTNVVTTTAINYSILTSDNIIKVTASATTMTLPTAVGNLGKVFSINNASIGSITVNTTGGQFINGLLAQSLPADSTMQVYSDGTGWHIS